MEKKAKVYAEGIRIFGKHQNAPDFVLGSLVITPKQLLGWVKDNADCLSDYNGDKQLKLQLLEGDNGMYAVVDTYGTKAADKPAPKAKAVAVAEDDLGDLPF